jgi:hypothetical protein
MFPSRNGQPPGLRKMWAVSSLICSAGLPRFLRKTCGFFSDFGKTREVRCFPTFNDNLAATPFRRTALRFHQVCKDVVYARQVTFAFGL